MVTPGSPVSNVRTHIHKCLGKHPAFQTTTELHRTPCAALNFGSGLPGSVPLMLLLARLRVSSTEGDLSQTAGRVPTKLFLDRSAYVRLLLCRGRPAGGQACSKQCGWLGLVLAKHQAGCLATAATDGHAHPRKRFVARPVLTCKEVSQLVALQLQAAQAGPGVVPEACICG